MCGNEIRRFDRLGFDPGYDVEIDPEFPAGGDWPWPVHRFDRDGHHVAEEFASRWGAPLVVHVIPAGVGVEWIGLFPAGGLGGIDGVFAGPGRNQMCVAVNGIAYLLCVDTPGSDAVVAHDQVRQVVSAVSNQLLLVVSYHVIVAVGLKGIAWRSPQLAVDDLQIKRVAPDGIHCTAETLEGLDVPIVVDPTTGLVVAGPRLNGPSWN